jgi:hypothetical protein
VTLLASVWDCAAVHPDQHPTFQGVPADKNANVSAIINMVFNIGGRSASPSGMWFVPATGRPRALLDRDVLWHRVVARSSCLSPPSSSATEARACPRHRGAPIVPGDHRLLDTERIKQADQMQQRVALYL